MLSGVFDLPDALASVPKNGLHFTWHQIVFKSQPLHGAGNFFILFSAVHQRLTHRQIAATPYCSHVAINRDVAVVQWVQNVVIKRADLWPFGAIQKAGLTVRVSPSAVQAVAIGADLNLLHTYTVVHTSEHADRAAQVADIIAVRA